MIGTWNKTSELHQIRRNKTSHATHGDLVILVYHWHRRSPVLSRPSKWPNYFWS